MESPSPKEENSTKESTKEKVIEGFSEEYKRDIEGCKDYIRGGIFDNPEKRYDEVSNPLVDEDRQEQQELFGKLQLPESEMLKTETNPQFFPENNRAAEPSIKIDKEGIASTVKSSGKEIASKAKGLFENLKEFREKNRQERLKKEKEAEEKVVFKPAGTSEVTDIEEVLENEPKVKTIEELKKPELASYPIIHPKTVEDIQQSRSENQEDFQEAKEIVEPEVDVPKDFPQEEKDPFLLDKKHKSKQSVWMHRITTKAKQCYHLIRESEAAKQILGIGVTAAVLGLCVAKRNSIRTINSIEQLKAVLKSPCTFHGAVLSTHPTSSILSIKQIPFPRYLMKLGVAAASFADASTLLPVSLLSLNANELQNECITKLMTETDQIVKKINVLYYPSQVNETLPDNVVYGDVLVKGFGHNAISRMRYHSLSRYLVRMGYCSVDRDINIDINSQTQKFMKKLGNDEIYAVRRKLGLWEERSSSFEDNVLVKGWFAIYRPLYKKFVLPKKAKLFTNP